MSKRFVRSAWVVLSVTLAVAGTFDSVTRAAPATTVINLGGQRILRANPAVADFNGDGLKEIVVPTDDGRLFVIGWNGSAWVVLWSRTVVLDINAANPPNPTGDTKITSAVAVADLDLDGKLEIVLPVGGLPQDGKNGGLLVYGYNSPWSFSIKGNWPQPRLDEVGSGPGFGSPDGKWDGIFSSAAVGDIDGDGDLEIVWEGEDRRIHAYHHDGSVVNGWPLYRWPPYLDPLTRGGLSSPAIGDLDGDGIHDIVVGGTSPQCTPSPIDGCGGSPNYTVAPVWAIRGDSTLLPGWPKYVGQWVDSSPALGDLDGDGHLDVVVGTGRRGIDSTGGYNVFAWKRDGTPLPGWPRPTANNMMSSPALADLDGSGLDVVIGCGADGVADCTVLYAWRGNGANVAGFPMTPLNANFWNRQPTDGKLPPVIADLDGNGQLEILLISHTSIGISLITAGGANSGANSADISRAQSPNDGAFFSSPLVADIDNDGLLETIAAGSVNGTNGSDGQAAVYLWQETGAALPARMPWPMFRHDNRRTGNYCFTEQPPAPPNTLSSSVPINTWSSQTTISATWTGATGFGCARLRGFSWNWSQSPSTVPDTVVDSFSNTTTSPVLGDGVWYFHVRARDEWGNWSGAAHFGPFWIDTTAPTAATYAPGIVAPGSVPVYWSGNDNGSGIFSYTVQARVGNGAWSTWLSSVPFSTTTAGYSTGSTTCNTLSFRVRARDVAGNLGAFSAPVTTTVGSNQMISGTVVNTVGEPVFNAQVNAPAACAIQPSDLQGRIRAYYGAPTSDSLSVSRSGFSTLPPLYNRPTGSQDLIVLPPATNVISRSHFEADGAWLFSSNAGYTTQAHSGVRGAAITGTGWIRQLVSPTVPAGSVLSLLMRGANVEPMDSALIELESGQHTVHLSPTVSTSWAHVWLNIGELAGQAVTLTFRANDNGNSGLIIVVDEVTLGSSGVGVYLTYLPIARR
ncbi:MAG: VCBS repeat-containing protein [Anaerolineae bacterium]|nr:VCBS repeat-containing protein [Thermoflexales bacterium]MDW8407485.1 VCBS repeat-containing protein [Anaerolineae bacterium]